jgi:hypothetical protein
MKSGWLVVSFLFISSLVFGQGGTKEVVICMGTSVRLTAASSGAIAFEWRKNGEVIPGFSGEELVVSEEGNYAAFALNQDACISDQSVLITLGFRHPVAVDDFLLSQKDTELLLEVLKNDEASCTNLDEASLVIKTAPQFGQASIISGSIRYKPVAGFDKTDSFTYSVRDKNNLESNVATVTLDLSNPLPVVLMAFEATKMENVTVMTWRTASETNSDHFEIERSVDGKNWETIGSAPAANSATEQVDYNFTDYLPESGLNYYRLKMIDLDKTYTYSYVRSVHFPEFSWAKLFPNPVNHTLHVVVRNRKVKKIRLINLSGQVMFNRPVETQEILIDMSGFLSGHYFVHLEQDNGLVAVFKIAHD